MDYSELLKLLETMKSPALVVLCFIAWQTVRAVSKGLDRLESIDGKLGRLTEIMTPMAEHADKVERKLDDIHDDLSGLPLELIRLKSVR